MDLNERSARLQLAAVLHGEDVLLPDYTGHGLFNLAVSIARVCGAPTNAAYADLLLPTGESATAVWRASSNVIFFLVDGLGDDYLFRNRDVAPTLWADRVGALHSVFPSTTATAITSVMTAEPASIHGLLGWYVRDNESGDILAPLPMRRRGGGQLDDDAQIDRLLQTPPALCSVDRNVCFVTLPQLAVGPYSQHYSAKARQHCYDEIEDLPEQVASAAKDGALSNAKFIYAYTPLLDSTAHDYGIASSESRQALARIEAAYVGIRKMLPDGLIIVSADHGFIDAPAERFIDLAAYPHIYAMLRGPLTGERRAAYCHVLPEFKAAFGPAIENELGHALCVISTELAIAAGLFGPGISTVAEARGGDWILIPRDDWTVFDRMPGENVHPMIGVHGGLSRRETLVPLILRPGSVAT